MKYTTNIEMHFVGYLYIMDVVNAREMKRINPYPANVENMVSF